MIELFTNNSINKSYYYIFLKTFACISYMKFDSDKFFTDPNMRINQSGFKKDYLFIILSYCEKNGKIAFKSKYNREKFINTINFNYEGFK